MNEELLKYAVDNGMIDLSYVQEQIEMKKREETLKKHPYKIWEGKNGYWYSYIFDDTTKERKLIKKRNQEDLEDFIIAQVTEEEYDPCIRDVFIEWNDRRLSLKQISKSTYDRNVCTFNRHYDDFGNKHIKKIKAIEFESFLEEQIPKYDLTAKAFSNLKTVTNGFLKYAYKKGLITFHPDNIFHNLDLNEKAFKKNIKEDYEEVYNDEEMCKMIEYLTNNMDTQNLAILLIFLTGARIGEIVTLKHSDFDEDVSFKIRRTETVYKNQDGNFVYDVKEFPKTSAGVRTAIIPNDFKWVVKKIKATNPFQEYIFSIDGKRLTNQSIRSRLYRICNKLGIYRKSPHKIRKTYGSILLDNNIDQRLILDQMGHTTIGTTENYYHRNRKNIETKKAILSDIPEFRSQKKA